MKKEEGRGPHEVGRVEAFGGGLALVGEMQPVTCRRDVWSCYCICFQLSTSVADCCFVCSCIAWGSKRTFLQLPHASSGYHSYSYLGLYLDYAIKDSCFILQSQKGG